MNSWHQLAFRWTPAHHPLHYIVYWQSVTSREGINLYKNEGPFSSVFPKQPLHHNDKHAQICILNLTTIFTQRDCLPMVLICVHNTCTYIFNGHTNIMVALYVILHLWLQHDAFVGLLVPFKTIATRKHGSLNSLHLSRCIQSTSVPRWSKKTTKGDVGIKGGEKQTFMSALSDNVSSTIQGNTFPVARFLRRCGRLIDVNAEVLVKSHYLSPVDAKCNIKSDVWSMLKVQIGVGGDSRLITELSPANRFVNSQGRSISTISTLPKFVFLSELNWTFFYACQFICFVYNRTIFTCQLEMSMFYKE